MDHVSSQRSSATLLGWLSPPVGVGGLAHKAESKGRGKCMSTVTILNPDLECLQSGEHGVNNNNYWGGSRNFYDWFPIHKGIAIRKHRHYKTDTCKY